MLVIQKQKDLLPAQNVVAVLADITAHSSYGFKDENYLNSNTCTTILTRGLTVVGIIHTDNNAE